MIYDNEPAHGKPTGFRVKPMNYGAIEDVADGVRPLFPTTAGASPWHIDALWTLQRMLPTAGYHYHVLETEMLRDCAAFTVPAHGLIVLREDIFDGLEEDRVFSRSTVVHEAAHIILDHAVTLHRGAPVGEHRFYEDSEWQAKALTAAIMMPIEACAAANGSPSRLAQLCGTSFTAASYRLQRVKRSGLLAAHNRKKPGSAATLAGL